MFVKELKDIACNPGDEINIHYSRGHWLVFIYPANKLAPAGFGKSEELETAARTAIAECATNTD